MDSDDRLLLLILFLAFLWMMSRPKTVVVKRTEDGYLIVET